MRGHLALRQGTASPAPLVMSGSQYGTLDILSGTPFALGVTKRRQRIMFGGFMSISGIERATQSPGTGGHNGPHSAPHRSRPYGEKFPWKGVFVEGMENQVGGRV